MNNYITKISLYIFSLLSLIIIISKVSSSADSSFGDFGGMVMVHEFLNQGYNLYSEIWDHKDLGFYFINNIFYDLAGITGLYLFALLNVMAYHLGFFLILKEMYSNIVAYLYSTIGVLIYVSLSSFKSTFSEDLAVSFALLSLGLFFNLPFFSGIILAMACTIKTTSLIIAIFLFIASLTIVIFMKDKTYLKKLLLFSFGFILATIILSLWFISADVLKEWFQIINYNSIYSQIIRGGYFPNLLEPKLLVMDIVRVFFGADKFFILLFFLLISSTMLLTWCKFNYPFNLWKNFVKISIISFSGFIAGFSMLYLQVPPSYHHYQHFAGLLIPLLVLFIGMIMKMIIKNNKNFLYLKYIIFAVPLLAFCINFSSYKYGLYKWFKLDKPGYMMESLSKIPPKNNIAILGGNHIRVDFTKINSEVRLSCRFFYQFTHILDAYKDEIFECFDNLPEIVFYGEIKHRNKYLANIWGEYYEEFSKKIFKNLKKEHKLCTETVNNMYQIYVKNEILCSHFKHIDLKKDFPEYYNNYVKKFI